MNLETRNLLITVVLAIIIVGMGYYLYHSIVGPYQVVIKRKKMTAHVHYRMMNIRTGIIRYNRKYNHFPPTKGGLDSVEAFLKNDSLMVANRDSIFKPKPPYHFQLDSLEYSPRPPHKKFEYTLNNNIEPHIYLLKDPDTNDHIGSAQKTTQLNAPSWR